jgi:hypothetical protein
MRRVGEEQSRRTLAERLFEVLVLEATRDALPDGRDVFGRMQLGTEPDVAAS